MTEPTLFRRDGPDPEWALQTLVEQYKLAVEIWDRVRARRQHANSFYVTINSAVVLALIIKGAPEYLVAPAAFCGIMVCVLWFFTIRSYAILTDRKLAVIEGLEQRLPSAPFSVALGGQKFFQFTHGERIIPFVFGGLYVCVILYAVGIIKSSVALLCV